MATISFLKQLATLGVPAPDRRFAPWFWPCGFVALHVLLMQSLAAHAAVVSLGFLVAAPLLAAWQCLVRGRAESVRGWLLLSFGLVLWAGAMAVNVLALALGNSSGETSLCMLLFVLYGVPVVFATASPDGESRAVRTVDAGLALALGVLFFVHTLSFSTMAGSNAGDAEKLARMFDIENLFILAFAGVRFATSSARQARDFFARLTLFALLYGLSATYINHMQQDADFGGPIDVVIEIPFLVLAVLARAAPDANDTANAFPVPRQRERLVEAASPLMLPAMLLAVAAALLASHPVWAEAGFGTATLVYGLRNVLAHLRNLEERDRLEQLAEFDALTGLVNRRGFDAALDRDWARARRTGEPLALLMIDIDHFKVLNDHWGHPEGDRRLRDVAQALAGCASRATDLVARYGGEEFVVILPATNAGQALQLAEIMRARVHNLGLPSPAPGGRISVSIGVGMSCHGEIEHTDMPAALLARADAALYDAKREGRNRVALQGAPL